jgi:hypothetical protein
MTTEYATSHFDRDLDQPAGAIVVGAYRYRLWRTCDASRPRITWVLLNPSTADATHDDSTLRRCLTFSQAWGYGRLDLINLFALRATKPQALYAADDPIGPTNDQYLATAVRGATTVIVAWGQHGKWRQRDAAMLALLHREGIDDPLCLGMVQNGCPRHPLYMPARPFSQLLRYGPV